jgi:hypothetical protein
MVLVPAAHGPLPPSITIDPAGVEQFRPAGPSTVPMGFLILPFDY